MKTLSQAMKKKRSGTGQTQAQVAEEVGVDRGTIIRYESGATYPDTRHRKKIADWLGVDSDDLPPFKAPEKVE